MRATFLVFIVLLLFLAACAPTGQTSVGKGVVLEFLEYPKIKLVETSSGGEEFSLKFKVSNFANVPVQGRLCVKDITFGLGGIPENTCSAISLEPAFKLDEKQVRESYQLVDLGPYTYTGVDPDPAKNQEAIISAELRYAVQSKHFMKVCLAQDAVTKTKNIPAECQDQASVTVSQDPLPLAIKNVQKDAHHLRNTANGEEILLKLNFEVALNDQNVRVIEQRDILAPISSASLVNVRVKGYGKEFVCVPLQQRTFFELRQGEKNELRCTATVFLDQSRLDDAVEVDLGYGASITVGSPAGPVKLIKEEEQASL